MPFDAEIWILSFPQTFLSTPKNEFLFLQPNFAIKILHHNPFEKHWGGQSQFSKLLIEIKNSL